MKKSLIVVCQLFQFIVAVQIRKTILAEEAVDLLIIDTCDGFQKLYDNITTKKNNVFDNVYIVKKETFSGKIDRMQKMIKYMLDTGNTYYDSFDLDLHLNYTSIYLTHFYHFQCALIKKNCSATQTEIYRFEEGYSAYLDPYCFIKKSSLWLFHMKELFSKIFHQPMISELLKGHLFFTPEIVQFKTKYNIYSIPKFNFNDKILYNFISNAFSLPDQNEFDKKYIFFEENIVGADIDDFGLVMKIAEKIGKENLIVKLHPRRPVDRFSKYGIKVSKSVGIPWEAFLMKYDFSDKVLMTISSGIAFSSRLYFNNNIKTFMLFRLFDSLNSNIPQKEKLNAYINAFYKVYGDSNFIIPNDKQQFLNML